MRHSFVLCFLTVLLWIFFISFKNVQLAVKVSAFISLLKLLGISLQYCAQFIIQYLLSFLLHCSTSAA